MTASKLHRVVVDRGAIPGYLEKGYAESAALPRDIMGTPAWGLLDKETRDSLVVVEIDQEKHRQLNAAPIAYTVNFRWFTRHVSVVPLKLDVLEPNSEDFSTVCAVHGEDDGRFGSFETRRLGKTPREAAEIAKPDILEAIETLRADADRLESFLRQNEVL